MLELPVRHTVSIRIGELIKNEYIKLPLPLTDSQIACLDVDCAAVQRLRTSIEANSSSLATMKEYYAAISAVIRKVKIDDVAFPWTNSLGSTSTMQNNGLEFERLNVLFNIAALSTRSLGSPEKQSAGYLFAASVLHHMQSYPKQETLPVELQAGVLQFLAELCATQARDAVCDIASHKWHLAAQYDKLAADLLSQPIMLPGWGASLEQRGKQLREEACLEAARVLHRSRKKMDQYKEKAALQMCLEFNARNDEALHMLHEPLGRKDKTSLRHIEAKLEFDPANYFDIDENPGISEPPPFHIAPSSFLDALLPLDIFIGPFVMAVKLRSYVQTTIVDRIVEMNQNVRCALAACGMPAAVEIVQLPGSVPQSLLALHPIVTQYRIADNIVECLTKLHECEKRLGENNGTLVPIIGELHKGILGLQSAWHCVSFLIQIIAAGEESIGEFIGFQSNRPLKHRSRPVFLERVDAICSKITASINTRIHKCQSLLEKASSYDFETPAKQLVAAQPGTKLSDLTPILEAAAHTFDDDLSSIERDQAIADRELIQIKELHAQFREYSRKLSTDDTKLKAVKALYTAAMIAGNVNQKIHIYRSAVEALDTITIPPTNPTPVTPPRNSSTPEFQWKPGVPIKFS